MLKQYKKEIFIFLFLLFISLVSLFPYFFHTAIFNQDDLLFHRTRLESYYQAVKHLDFFPRVFPEMGLYYGYGADLFYPSILLLPFALFRLVGFPFVSAYYLYQLLISLATASSAFYFMYTLKKNTYSALLFACFYTLATYRLIDQSVRGALGETLAFIFVPLVALGLYSFFYSKKPRLTLLAVGMSLLIASHLITAFYSFLFSLVFVIFHWKKWTKKKWLTLFSAALLTLALSAWFIFPYFEQVSALTFNFSKVSLWQTGLTFTASDLLSNSLATVSSTFNELKPNIGIVLLLSLLFAIINYSKLTLKNKQLTLLTVGMLLLSTNLFPWGLFKTSIFATIQFPWRLLLFGSFFASLLAVSLSEQFLKQSKKQLILFLAISSFITLSFNVNMFVQSQNKQSLTVTNETVSDFYESEIGHGKEYLVKDTDFKTYFTRPGLIIDGVPYVNSAEQTKNTYSYSRYTVQTNGTQEIQLPKFYYKGYEVRDNQTIIPNYNKNGLVTVKVAAGTHSLTISYKKTAIQKIATSVSLLTGFILLLTTYFPFKKTNF